MADYGDDVAESLAVRKQAFAAFVRRALAHAHTTRGWSVPRVADEAGIGNPTIYRWRDGVWKRSPQPEQVVAFCDALDIPPARAFEILWPGKTGRPAGPTPPVDMPSSLVTIARKLHDPNVPEPEKYHLRESLSALADRPNGGYAGHDQATRHE